MSKKHKAQHLSKGGPRRCFCKGLLLVWVCLFLYLSCIWGRGGAELRIAAAYEEAVQNVVTDPTIKKPDGIYEHITLFGKLHRCQLGLDLLKDTQEVIALYSHFHVFFIKIRCLYKALIHLPLPTCCDINQEVSYDSHSSQFPISILHWASGINHCQHTQDPAWIYVISPIFDNKLFSCNSKYLSLF